MRLRFDSTKQMDQLQPECPATERQPEEADGLSDQNLVAEVLCRDRKATAQFVSRCADPVYAYIRRRLAPRADLVEDMVQEVFLAAWEHLGQYRGASSLRAWILGIARHKVEDYYRRKLREILVDEEPEGTGGEHPAGTDDLEQTMFKLQMDRHTREVLASLHESSSLILQWRYWEQRSLREIASQTGKTEKAVERLLARARQQFKKRWNERQSTIRRSSV